MLKTKETFVAMQRKNGPVRISYFELRGRKITLTDTKIVPAREVARIRAQVRRGR